MRVKVTPAEAIDIFIAGDIGEAKRVCRQFCERGFCVTVEPLEFVYKYGAESGVKVGVKSYPRFPTSSDDLFDSALELAHDLIEGLSQGSAMVCTSTQHFWFSRREED